jgi:pimeloyl-ACP methyl ester carboxylesterase
VEAGPPDGPPVLLLHGFPEFWHGWRHQIPTLARAGYHVLVPDQRGYNRSDAPADVAAYDLTHLVADALAILEAHDAEQAHVVGHDWGAVVAWALAAWHPERVRQLGILNVPHPAVFQETLRSSLDQLRRSWYILFFQIPQFPEWLLSRNHHNALIRMLVGSGQRGTFSDDDLGAYRRAWLRSGVGPMLHWYRAAARRAVFGGRPVGRIMPETLVIWGAKDVALSQRMARPSVAMCENGRLNVIDDATHWVQHDAAGRVNRLLLAHLDAAANPSP